MRFLKNALTFDDQVAHLQQRGMAGDAVVMKARLESVSYYRLSAYWHTFREADSTFRAGTCFDDVWDRYTFDRALRLLVLDAIERVEVAVRTRLAYGLARAHGPFGYADDPTVLWAHQSAKRASLLDHIDKEVGRSHERFVTHFAQKYGDCHRRLPIWVTTEVMSFGTVLSLYRGSPSTVQAEVASMFGVAELVTESWLLTLNTIRNQCAHHSRLWNCVLGVRPKLPRERVGPDWHVPVRVDKDQMFAVLTILCDALAQIAPGSQWASRLDALLRQHPRIPTREMGFPPRWTDCPIWQRALQEV